MKSPDLLLLADRGQFKAYEVRHPDGRGLAVRLIDAYMPIEPHKKISERYTDQAGAFPNQGSAGAGQSIAERASLKHEVERRACVSIAEHINALLVERQPRRWAFAAPSTVNQEILVGVAAEWQDRLAINLNKDLVGRPANELIPHFEL